MNGQCVVGIVGMKQQIFQQNKKQSIIGKINVAIKQNFGVEDYYVGYWKRDCYNMGEIWTQN